MKTLLVIDGDLSSQTQIRERFEREGYDVFVSSRAGGTVELAVSAKPSAVLLEQTLPDGGGHDLCRALRRHITAPIFMMSARSEEPDRVRAFDLGADDFVAKPLRLEELAARLRAALRRHGARERPDALASAAEPGKLTAGCFVADTGARTVTVSGEKLPLTSKEFDLLLFFMKSPGRVFTKEMLYANVWGSGFAGDTRTVMVYISRLRKKIEETPNKPKYILNVWGVGYKLNCGE
ncbi:MAG: response regulator transcription factor [Oscillospiraceae bacterium]|jgi:two-component system alkaline phosphatase synthesis response regulator PhoP|nr:response regulator transcription factor [Oscillospiraceae bacterium]